MFPGPVILFIFHGITGIHAHIFPCIQFPVLADRTDFDAEAAWGDVAFEEGF
jgi:hypothetical protein